MKNSFVFETISQENYIQAGECLSDVFFREEPVTSRLNLEPESYSHMVINFCRVIGKDGLCFLARENETGNVAGVITNIDMMIDFGEKFAGEPDYFYQVIRKLAPDIAMTTLLEEKFIEEKKFLPGECLHLFQCAVLQEYRKQGIAAALVDVTISKAVEKGYKWAAVDCTGEISKQIFDELGFTLFNKIKYSDFEFEGAHPFAGLPGYYYFLAKKIA